MEGSGRTPELLRLRDEWKARSWSQPWLALMARVGLVEPFDGREQISATQPNLQIIDPTSAVPPLAPRILISHVI